MQAKSIHTGTISQYLCASLLKLHFLSSLEISHGSQTFTGAMYVCCMGIDAEKFLKFIAHRNIELDFFFFCRARRLCTALQIQYRY